MASSDKSPAPTTTKGADPTPGEPLSIGQHMVDKGAEILQSLKPIRQISQHACSFAAYSHDMSRQIETHHFCHRLNQDFLQCAVYDSDYGHARLLGVEYIVSDRIFEAMPPEEQKLWHSHAYEIKSGMWVNPGVPEMIAKPELENLQKLRQILVHMAGDVLPLGAPTLMVSPQPAVAGMVRPELIQKRDEKNNINTMIIKNSRANIAEPGMISPLADYWVNNGKGFAIDIEVNEMNKKAKYGYHNLQYVTPGEDS